MLCIIGFFVLVIGVVLTYLEIYLGGIICFIAGVILLITSLLIPKAEYKQRELIFEYELIPIASNAYVIKTYNGKIICKYLDHEQNNKTVIDTVISYWKEINEIADGEKPTIRWYERKQKLGLRSIPFTGSRIEVVLNIPKNSVIS